MKNLKVNLIRRINVEPAPQPEAAPSPALANGLICPLTRKPFTDPVIAPNGVTYNADAIYPYLKKHGHLPTDNRPVTPSKIWPDQNMRDRLSTNPHRDKDEYLEDPITFDTMTNPVVASDGRTYNQSSLEMLFREHNGISPFSRAQLATTGYRNQTLITELNPKVGQARTATLANAPTQNLVNFGPEAEADNSPPQQRTYPKFVKIAAALFCVAVLVAGPAFVASTVAGLVTFAVASVIIPLCTQTPNIYQFFQNRAARRRM